MQHPRNFFLLIFDLENFTVQLCSHCTEISYFRENKKFLVTINFSLKRLSHQIFWYLFWPMWIDQDWNRYLYLFEIFRLLLWFYIAIFSFWSISCQISWRWILEKDLQILKVCDWSIVTFLGEPLTNGEKSDQFLNVSPIILMNCRFVSESY